MSTNESFLEYAKSMGVEIPELGKTEVANTGGYYQHKLGEYHGLLLDYEEKWVIKDGNKKKFVEKGTAGATSYGTLRIAIIKDPEKQLLGNDFKIPDEIEYGRLVWNQFLTHEPDRQYGNKQLLDNLFIDGIHEASVVTGEGRDFQIDFRKLALYYGAPVKFTLDNKYGTNNEKEAKNPFVKGAFELTTHSISKEILEKRKKVADFIKGQLDAKKDKEAKEREAKSSSSSLATPAEDSTANTDFLSQYGG